MKLEWSNIQPPDEYIKYTHTTCKTPLGEIRIEWKSWKDYPSYGFYVYETDYWIGSSITLEDAKQAVEDYIMVQYNTLKEFVENE